MSRTTSSPSASHRSQQQDQRRRRRRTVRITGLVALLLGVAFVVFVVVWVGGRALAAKDSLTAAQSQIMTFKSALGQPNAPSTVTLYKKLQKNTSSAAEDVHDPVWSLVEAVPVVGKDLKVFRQVTQMLDALVQNGIKPVAYAANGISEDSLKPKNGAIDIEPLKALTPAIAQLDTALGAAQTSIAVIDTKGTLPQITSAMTTLSTTIDKVKPVTAELRKVMPVLYPALGGDGTRHYLLMFQNNAEERASGGNPAALAMLKVDDGKVSLGKQPNSGDFPRPYSEPVLKFGGDWDKIYGSYVTTYETNTTMTPDFPTVAKITRKMWTDSIGGKVDGVISFDPVALSYLLNATGPVKLKTGETLTSTNVVQYLLSGVYAKYSDPTVQNAVFASAAQAVFSAVTSGQGSVSAYITELTPMMNDQRLKMWSVRKDEEDLILTSPTGNMLPADNSKTTTLGVYNNDDATSKMSYYMDSTVDVAADTCTATPTYTVSTKVTDTLKTSQIAGLSSYVLANQQRIDPGGDRQWVQIYGPVGAKFVSATIDGQKVVFGNNINYLLNTNSAATGEDDHRPAVHGTMYGRPVAVVSIKMDAQQSVTVKAKFSGGTDPSKSVTVSHTPKVRAVPVTITDAKCG